ncbi:MAG: response regulator transcription factor [Halobacteriovoraceae bacterium]|nr:response regulator transcription factor [Halobacteriovoraceae bacterium]MCB9095903.1 response regulator transcription factor [Halobacteriovoraceae bacterium]
MTKLLLVEDDSSLGESLRDYLESEAFAVDWSQSIADAQSKISQDAYEIVVLDWMLPDGQGIDLLKSWRNDNIKTPVIMLTARSDLLDKVVGLESGAHDYMTKPFEPRELVARIRVQLRKSPETQEEDEKIIIRKGLQINKETRDVTFNDQEVYLTKMEYELLLLLAENPGRPFTRDELLNKVWGFEFTPSTRTVDTHVLQLRQKLEEEIIDTVRGVGYRFNKNYLG